MSQLLVINAGSSSIKFATFSFDDKLEKNIHGIIENIKTAPSMKLFKPNENEPIQKSFAKECDYAYFYALLFTTLSEKNISIKAVGHRVVHGGDQYPLPILLNQEIINDLKELIPFAPLHQPYNIQAIEMIHEFHSNLPQVACFDTAFHRTHPKIADLFGLPHTYFESGIHRYGFHGLSYEYIMYQITKILPEKKNSRIVVAHLGNGASLCAIKNQKSIDSTMGFTALDGLVMGTRCGSIDPGVLLYLMKFKKMQFEEIQNLLYQKSGLLGISGLSHNMKILQESQIPAAKEAIDLFVYRVRKELGALVSVLGGLDVLVFTGGIGENAHFIRELICEDMDWLHLKLDKEKNANHLSEIHTADSQIEIRVIPTNEEWIIAKDTYQLVKVN